MTKADLADKMVSKMEEILAQHKASGEKLDECGHSNCISAMTAMVAMSKEMNAQPEASHDKSDNKISKRSK